MYWLDGCDFVGRTENFNADFAFVESQIKSCNTWWYRLRHRGPVERRNTTRRSDYRQYYDAASAEFVSIHFAPEISRFGYEFDAPGSGR